MITLAAVSGGRVLIAGALNDSFQENFDYFSQDIEHSRQAENKDCAPRRLTYRVHRRWPPVNRGEDRQKRGGKTHRRGNLSPM